MLLGVSLGGDDGGGGGGGGGGFRPFIGSRIKTIIGV